MSAFHFLNAGNLYQVLNIKPHRESITAFKELVSHVSTMCGQLHQSHDVDMHIFQITQPMVAKYREYALTGVGDSQLIEYEITFNKPITPISTNELNMYSPTFIGDIIKNLQHFNNYSNYIHFTCSKNRDSIRHHGLQKIPGKELLNSTLDEFPYPEFPTHKYHPDNILHEKALIQAAPPSFAGGKRKSRKRKSKKRKLRKIKLRKHKSKRIKRKSKRIK